MLAIVSGGSASPQASMPAMPALCVSQANGAPTASRTSSVASVTSGPIPSPGISVAGMEAMSFSPVQLVSLKVILIEALHD
jgi:hypothetical protein